MRKYIPYIAFAIVGVTVVLQIYRGSQTPPPPSLTEDLSEIIPAQLEGWTVRELELGATEALRERSEQLLNLDDFVQREYSRGGKSFTVYIAYWTPGKMPVRLVNQHTPDRCWTEVGFVCTDREWNLQDLPTEAHLQPAQYGIFEKEDLTLYTYFWHMVNGEAHWYGENRVNTRSSLASVWIDLKKFGFNVHREQFFVRLSSAHPFDELWEEPGFQVILQDLSKLCLAPEFANKDA
jgi:hypothetical protein